MKTIIIAICALVLITTAILQSSRIKQPVVAHAPKKADEVIKFLESQHNFGKIRLGVPITYNFTFKNIGNTPVVIEYAKASCGCTTPKWTKAPVTKGKEGKVAAGFNAAIIGAFNKAIFVKVVGYTELLPLQITGEVVSAEEYTQYKAAAERGLKKNL